MPPVIIEDIKLPIGPPIIDPKDVGPPTGILPLDLIISALAMGLDFLILIFIALTSLLHAALRTPLIGILLFV